MGYIFIDGKKYSTKDWRKWHPGGVMIEVPDDGMDCTALFNSYHPVGMMKTKETFYTDLKREIQDLFGKKSMRDSRMMHAKAAYILGMSVFSWVLCWMYNMLWWAPIMGFFKAMVGVNIQHDANHGAYCSNPRINEVMGYTLDIFGASSYIWKQTHVKGHHVHTNHKQDPDIRTDPDGDIRTISSWDTVRWYHAYQHLYLPFLYTLLSIKSCAVDDFVTIWNGRVGKIHMRPMSEWDAHMFWLGKIFFFVTQVYAPIRMVGVLRYLLIMGISELTTGCVLSNLFQVAHVSPLAEEHPRDESTVDDWARRQVESSVDFAPGDFFWTHVSGGLNHQVIHHLFPGVNHCYYPFMWKTVKKVCKKHGIKYTHYPTFWEALKAHYTRLKQ